MEVIAVDTSVLIDFLRGNPPETKLVSKLIKNGCGAITAISVFELQVGIPPGSRREEKLGQLINYLEVLPLDRTAAMKAGLIERELRTRGQLIGVADVLIAGICLAHNVPLATRNRDHFERVPGLNLYHYG